MRSGSQFRTQARESQGNSASLDYTECTNNSAMTHPSKTPVTTASRPWAGIILFLAFYSWEMAYKYYLCMQDTWEHVSCALTAG